MDGFSSDQRKNDHSIYGGGYFSNNFGLELGYTYFDRINLAGGSTKAEGYSASLVGLDLVSAFQTIGFK